MSKRRWTPATSTCSTSPGTTRACLLNARWSLAVLQDRSEEQAAEEGQGVLVVTGGDPTPLLEPPEATFDGVALSVGAGVEVATPAKPAPCTTLVCCWPISGIRRSWTRPAPGGRRPPMPDTPAPCTTSACCWPISATRTAISTAKTTDHGP